MSTIKGDISEAALTLAFLQRGYEVLEPVSSSSRYDLVIDRGNGFERVQCKTGRLKKGVIRFYTCSSSGGNTTKGVVRKHYRTDADLFGVYVPETGQCFLIPVADVPITEASLRMEASKNGQTKNIIYGDKYQI